MNWYPNGGLKIELNQSDAIAEEYPMYGLLMLTYNC